MPATAAATTTRSTCTVETVRGEHVFDIFGYSLHKGMGADKFLQSATFSVGGHDWAIRFYPDTPRVRPGAAAAAAGRGAREYVFVYLVLMSEGATARASCDLGLVDRATGRPAMVHATAEPRVFTYGEQSMFYPEAAFMGRAELEASPYLADDRLTIRCAVTVIKEPRVSASAAGGLGFGRLTSLGVMASCWPQLRRMRAMSLSFAEGRFPGRTPRVQADDEVAKSPSLPTRKEAAELRIGGEAAAACYRPRAIHIP
ncbi:hypothetical protein C2845_PM14G05690 [Panicum miliaceum]|uniref:MATH domain-containing protein n=1 Tax=Panicum miliaceum TaxID=4540 RepID=A0A3L6PSH6_PANMI|nr:hypothetical protein C2845_PM14G05690 [Panicum miliaceum]